MPSSMRVVGAPNDFEYDAPAGSSVSEAMGRTSIPVLSISARWLPLLAGCLSCWLPLLAGCASQAHRLLPTRPPPHLPLLQGCFDARLHHQSVKPRSEREHLKVAFFFRRSIQRERLVRRDMIARGEVPVPMAPQAAPPPLLSYELPPRSRTIKKRKRLDDCGESIPRPRGPAPSSKLFAHTRLVWNHSTGEWDEPAMADGGNSAGGNSAGGNSAGGNSAGGSSAAGNSAGALDETAVAAAASAPAEQVEQAEAAEQAGAAGTEPEAEAIDKAMDAAMDAAMDVDVEAVMAEEAMAEVAVLEEEAVVEDAVAAEQANRVQAQSAGSE